MDKGAYTAPNRITFGEHAENWLRTYARMHLRVTTVEGYESVFRNHAIPALGHLQLTKLTPLHLQELYAHKLSEGLGNRRVQYLHTIIHGCLKHAVKWGLLTRNVADAVDAPRPQRREHSALIPEQIGVLLKSVEGHPLEMIVQLAIGTGLRRGEILALSWDDVDLDAGVIRVRRSLVPTKAGNRVQEPKTVKGRRSVPLPRSTVSALKHQRAKQAEHRLQLASLYQNNGLVCAREDGSPFQPGAVTQMFARLTKKAGLPPIRFHDLRHTHASLLLERGVHPKVVQERLGHSTILVTMDTYSHVMPTLQQEAALKLDEALRPRKAK